MNKQMNVIYLYLFQNFPLMGFFWAFFSYSGLTEHTKAQLNLLRLQFVQG